MSIVHRMINLARNATAKAQAAVAIPPNPMDCRRPPVFGEGLPYEMGAGGWPVEEPTQEELHFFLELLSKVPLTYFGPYRPDSADYGTLYSAAIRVKQWLRLIDERKLLAKDDGT